MKNEKIVPKCDSCGQAMELSKNFGVKPRGIKKLRYRVRRFGCDLCGTSTTIFADGQIDDHNANQAVVLGKNVFIETELR